MSLCLFLLVACASPEVREVPADEVLTSIREAVGADALGQATGGVQVQGTCHEHGVDGTFQFLFDPAGRFLHGVQSRLGETVGFDGETGWGKDNAGVVRRMSFGGLVTTQGWLWVQSGHWLSSDAPLAVTRLEGSDGDSIVLRLARTDRPWTADLFVDPDSHLPQRLVHRRSSGERVYTFDGWTDALGFRYPHRVSVRNVAGNVSTFEAEEVAAAPSFFRSPFEPVFHRPQDAPFREGVSGVLEARRVSTGHLLVHPRVSGRDVGWFILDSGASTLCIDPEVADELGMESFGEITVVGAGGATSGRFRGGARLEMGPLHLPEIPWLEVDTSFLEPFFGVAVAGVVGYEFFARAVVVVDPNAGEVEVVDPATFELASIEGQGAWQELRFDDRIPCVQASFEGDQSGWFRVDTGSDDSVIFHGPTVESLGLLEGRKTYGAVHAGVGGSNATRRGKLEWFELGGLRFEGLDASFSTAEESALATPYTAGILGGIVFRPSRIVLDYGGERIAFLRRDEQAPR